jgi:ankyrin repeat protein
MHSHSRGDAFNIAINTKDIEMARVLLPFGPTINYTILYEGLVNAGRNQEEWLALLKEHTINLSTPTCFRNVNAMHYAIEAHDLRLIRLLWQYEQNFLPRNVFLLEKSIAYICQNNLIDIAKLLILETTDTNIRNRLLCSFMEHAIDVYNLEMAKLLASHGADFSSEKIMNIIYAKEGSSTKNLPSAWVNLLIKYKRPLNVVNEQFGDTPLIYMAYRKQPYSMLQILEAAPETINLTNNKGETALTWTLYHKDIYMLDALLAYKVNIDGHANEVDELIKIGGHQASVHYARLSCFHQLSIDNPQNKYFISLFNTTLFLDSILDPIINNCFTPAPDNKEQELKPDPKITILIKHFLFKNVRENNPKEDLIVDKIIVNSVHS